MEKAKLNGYDIEVFDNENYGKQVIIFAHGLGTNYRQWLGQIEYFKDYRVIAISLQGHGKSTKAAYDEFTIDKYLDTYQALLKYKNIESCIWVGNSMGGVLGYGILKRDPHMISKLITNGTTPKLMMSNSVLKLIFFMDRLLIKLMKFDGYVRFASKHASQYPIKDQLNSLFIESSKETIISSHQLLGRYDYLDVLDNRISIIINPLDKDINKYLKKYNQNILDSKVETYKLANSGHIANLEVNDDYNKLVSDIINK